MQAQASTGKVTNAKESDQFDRNIQGQSPKVSRNNTGNVFSNRTGDNLPGSPESPISSVQSQAAVKPNIEENITATSFVHFPQNPLSEKPGGPTVNLTNGFNVTDQMKRPGTTDSLVKPSKMVEVEPSGPRWRPTQEELDRRRSDFDRNLTDLPVMSGGLETTNIVNKLQIQAQLKGSIIVNPNEYLLLCQQVLFQK